MVTSSQAPPHAIIMLASGLSTRLRQSKQLLYKQGEPLISHMLKLALSIEPQVIIVMIPKDDLIANTIAPVVSHHHKIKVVVNPAPLSGMAHSLSLAIDSLRTHCHQSRSTINRVLIMGVDQVLLDCRHLHNLLTKDTSVVASGYLGLNPDFSSPDTPKNINGLPIVIDITRLLQWQHKLSGDKGLRYLIRDLSPEQISMVTAVQLSYDVDTPDQLAYARRQGWLDEHDYKD